MWLMLWAKKKNSKKTKSKLIGIKINDFFFDWMFFFILQMQHQNVMVSRNCNFVKNKSIPLLWSYHSSIRYMQLHLVFFIWNSVALRQDQMNVDSITSSTASSEKRRNMFTVSIIKIKLKIIIRLCWNRADVSRHFDRENDHNFCTVSFKF